MEKRMNEVKSWPTGLIEVAPSTYAYIQAIGSAGISNAGLVVGSDQGFVIDVLITITRTLEFLDSIRRVTQLPISHILLTHSHTDHFLGLQVLMPTKVVSHAFCREWMRINGVAAAKHWVEFRPEFTEGLLGFRLCLPDETFEDRITFYSGDKEIQFFNWGNVHTRGDGLVYLPKERVLFAGDIAFFQVTPLAWQGHIGNWIKALNRILDMEIETIVPGHGPVGGKAELAEMRDYLQLVYDGAKESFNRGLSESEAAKAIKLGKYSTWANPERIEKNVIRSYQELRGEDATMNRLFSNEVLIDG